MPRVARKKGETGIYHVMLRGINRQNIFEDEEDNEKFLQVLEECKIISGYKILAYCLMGNHIHLLIKIEEEPLELVFRRVGARFVYLYNWKYKRTGHLFQDRFKSEPIEDNSYLLTVLRYIHQNPLKAKLCSNINSYKWSSYDNYINENGIVDCEYVLSCFGNDKLKAVEQFIDYHKEITGEKCLEIEDANFRLTDDELRKLMKKVCGTNNITDFQIMDIKRRDKMITKLKAKGMSIRQISRLTGISFGIVRKL